jgi:ribose/xylose/arabinose/galactoside ABC-type transport system permease subunit
MPRKLTNSEIKARLILIVGITLSVTFVLSTASLLYGLLFVVQPLEVSPNDESAWSLLAPMMLFLTGALSGILASNGLKDKDKDNPND